MKELKHSTKMKRIIAKIALATAVVAGSMMLTGCKTTEANYRAAYELAKNKGTSDAVDADVYQAIEKESQPQTQIVGGDSIGMRREYLAVAKGDKIPDGKIMKYNVAVGQFKQIFNARMMCQRLIGMGYAEACVLKTREQEYVVIAAATDDREALTGLFEKVKGEKGLALRAPFPYVVIPA